MINAGYLSDSTRNELFEQFKELSELLRETSEIIEGIAYTFYNSDEETDEDESDEYESDESESDESDIL